MMNFFYESKNIGVVGYGKTGYSTVRALEKFGANIFLFDDKIIDSPYYQSLENFDWQKLDLLVVSPGIHLWWDIHPAVKHARRFFIPIINDLDIFQSVTNGKVIAITGTNGKSTTTALIHHIFQNKYKTEIGGNFGNPVLDLRKNSDFYVLELSSYQLESCNLLGFDTAILLNITPDHLTRHGGMEGYISTKQKIFANTKENSTAIIGIDDEYCRHILDFISHPKIIKISGKEVPENGIGWHENNLVDNRENQFRIVGRNIPRLDGDHNRQNIAAAYAASVSNGINAKIFTESLVTFSGLEHRQELVKSINGALYVNDSKATNADSVEQALKRFENIIWILGGRPKEDGIESLSSYFSKIKYAFLIGEAAEKWHEFLSKNHVENEIVFTLENAVKKSYRIAQNKDVVLLSPACASFDQFQSFEDRGEKFRKFVEELPC